MKIPEHLAMSYLIAQLGPQQSYGTTGTLLVMVAGMLPDLDGISILGGWRCHLKYHRKVGHGLPITLFGPLLLALGWAWWGEGQNWLVLWGWFQISLLLHLLVDLLFYRWRVQLLWPFSEWGPGYGLIAWNDLIPTLLLYASVGLVLVWPMEAVLISVVGLLLLGVYVGWRAGRRGPFAGFLAWITGGWAPRSPRFFRWLTGDFVT